MNSVLYLGIVKSFFAVLNTAKRKETLIDIHTHTYMCNIYPRLGM